MKIVHNSGVWLHTTNTDMVSVCVISSLLIRNIVRLNEIAKTERLNKVEVLEYVKGEEVQNSENIW